MPQYMLLIYAPAGGPPSSQDLGEQTERWMAYTQDLGERGDLVASDRLCGVETATTVRVRHGETLIVDGPFAETKEILAGYYVLDCPDLDAALAHAARVPHIHYGSVEVRPLMGVGRA